MDRSDLPSEASRNNDEEQRPSPKQSGEETYTNIGTAAVISPSGRFSRPSPASGRRSSAFRRVSQDGSTSWSPVSSAATEETSLGARLDASLSSVSALSLERTPSRSPWSSKDRAKQRIVEEDETNDSAETDQHQDKDETAEQQNNKEIQKLRTKYADLEKQFKLLDTQCHAQNDKIDKLEEERIAAESIAERWRLDLVEMKNSKKDTERELKDSQAVVRQLKNEIDLLEPLKSVKSDLDAAEHQLGDRYDEILRQQDEIGTLRKDNGEFTAKILLLEMELNDNEQARTQMAEELQYQAELLEKIHKLQIVRDFEQFALCDAQILELLDDPQATRLRDSMQATQDQQKALSDLMSSRPSSTFGSLSRSTTLESIGPLRSASIRQSMQRAPPSLPAALDLGEDTRRQSEPSHAAYVPRKASLLRFTSIPLEHQNFHNANLSILSEDVNGKVTLKRSMSTPLTKEEQRELRDYLNSVSHLFIWDANGNHAVYLPDSAPVAPSHAAPATLILQTTTSNSAEATSSGTATGHQSPRQRSNGPSPIITNLDEAATPNVDEATATSTSIDSPLSPRSLASSFEPVTKSPVRRRRVGRTTLVTDSGSPVRVESPPNSRPLAASASARKPRPGPNAITFNTPSLSDKTEEIEEVVGNVGWTDEDVLNHEMPFTRRRTIPAVTTEKPTEEPIEVQAEPPKLHQASPWKSFGRLFACVILALGAILLGYCVLRGLKSPLPARVSATSTVSAEMWVTSTSTATKTAIELTEVTSTTTKVVTLVETELAPAITPPPPAAPPVTSTEIETVTQTDTSVLWLTRNVTHEHVSTVFLTLTSISVVVHPSTIFTTATLFTTSMAVTTTTSTSVVEVEHVSTGVPSPVSALSDTQRDSRAAKARKSMQAASSRAYLGRSYWGWVPEVQRWLDLLEFKVLDGILEGGWSGGAREY